jgi:Na+/proline symporter
MWSVALTDFFQSIVIFVGLIAIAFLVSDMAGGAGKVLTAAAEAGKFEFWPKGGTKEWLFFITAWLTLALGSIPQQDVFQRVTSAKDERTAVKGTLIGALVYFCFAFVPIFIAYSAVVIDPTLTKLFASDDAREVQRILPELILDRMPLWAQVLFVTLRIVLVVFAAAALLFALNSRSTMYEMVQSAYKVTLVGAFVPLAAGLFWKRATAQGALLAVAFGISSWLLLEVAAADGTLPPQLGGLLAAIAGMVLGSLLPQRYGSTRGGVTASTGR